MTCHTLQPARSQSTAAAAASSSSSKQQQQAAATRARARATATETVAAQCSAAAASKQASKQASDVECVQSRVAACGSTPKALAFCGRNLAQNFQLNCFCCRCEKFSFTSVSRVRSEVSMEPCQFITHLPRTPPFDWLCLYKS